MWLATKKIMKLTTATSKSLLVLMALLLMLNTVAVYGLGNFTSNVVILHTIRL
jgi:hypothetical protein